MKYFSDVTKKVYDSVEELEKAEEVVNNKAAARKKDAENVDIKYSKYIAAKKEFEDALTDFCAKHGAYHRTIKIDDSEKMEDIKHKASTLGSLIDFFL